MIHPRRKKNIITTLKSKIILILFLIIIIFLSRSVYNIYKKEQIVKEKRNEILTELNELEERKMLLEAKINNLSTEKGVEEEIRRKFDVAKDGENIVIIVNEEYKDNNENGKNKDSIFKRILLWFR